MYLKVVLIISFVSILSASIEEIRKVFAPNGVFNGIQIYKNFKLKKDMYNNEDRMMYKTGANGAEWEVRIWKNKSIELIGKPIKCCQNYLNQFVTFAGNHIFNKQFHCYSTYAVICITFN